MIQCGMLNVLLTADRMPAESAAWNQKEKK